MEVEDKRLQRIAQRVGERIPKKQLLIWFREADLLNFLKFFELWAAHSGLFDCDIENIEGCYSIVIKHELGRKWSEFMMHAIERAVKIVTGTAPKFEVQGDVLIVKFSIPTKREFVMSFKTQRS